MGMKAAVPSLKLNGSGHGSIDPAGRLIGLLEAKGFDPRPTGADKWESRCPAHDGSRHNLSIARGDDGTALVHCHHDPSCTADAIAQAVGLTLSDLFPAKGLNGHAKGNGKPKKPAGKGGKKVHPTIETAVNRVVHGKKASRGRAWIYQDANGQPSMAATRFDMPNGDKTYLPFHPVEGGWSAGDPPGKLPLYHLPEVLKAKRVYFVEGEKGADLVASLGLVGTTTAHGAEAPEKSDLSALAGKEVIAIPDNDTPGKIYVAHIAALLSELNPVPTFRILELPLTAEGDDIEQWLEGLPDGWEPDQCREALEQLAGEAERFDLDDAREQFEGAKRSSKAKGKPKAAGGNGNGKRRTKAEAAAEKAIQKAEEVKTAKEGASGDVGLYFEKNGNLWHIGSEDVEALTNFTARIVANVERHEGATKSTHYQVRASHQDPEIGARENTIPSDKYASMSWVYALGAEFAMYAGREVREHTRCAVQLLSKQDGIASIVEHTSLGWIKHDDKWLYLHAAGAIGADGPTDAVRVELPGDLAKYRLPEPPTDPAAVKAAIRATLETSQLAKSGTPGARGAAGIVMTLPYRAILGPLNISPHLGGPSGTRKTSVARLVLQHFSTEFRGKDAEAPASWEDTKAALQRMAYDCSCAVLLIDDLKTQAQLEMAEEVVQNQGNLHGRARMATNRSLEPALHPRGAILSTGEIDCKTVSSLGRMLSNPMRTADIDLGVLTRLQKLGDEGLFATATSAYTQWLAPRLDEVRERLVKLKDEIRDELGDISGAHPRHPEAIAELLAGYWLFLAYAVEVEAIEPSVAGECKAKAREYLIELAENQGDAQAEAKPGRKFLDLIAAALRSKRCHLAVANSDNAPQTYPGASGWHKDWLYQGKDEGQMLDWKIPANSKLVGFIDEGAGLIYLDDLESVAVANEQGRRHNNLQSFANVGRELLNEGLCQSHVEGKKTRATGLKRIHNHSRKRYYWIAIPNLFGDEGSAGDA